MEFISSLGSIPFILTIVFGITFALNFKKGVVLVNIVAWTAMFTVLLKHQIDFPRPIDTDSDLICTDYAPPSQNLTHLQPDSFFEAFSSELLSLTRNDEAMNYGFPSGHTSIQVALWFGLFFLFRKRWIIVLGSSIVLLTMLSRLYLSHHFLGDVLGGLTLGLLVLGLLGVLINKSQYLTFLSPHFRSLSILWLPVFMIPFVGLVPVWILGSLIGLNVAATFIILQGNTLVFDANYSKRILTAVTIIVFIFIAYYINRNSSYSKNQFIELFVISFINFAIIRGSIFIAKRFNFVRHKL